MQAFLAQHPVFTVDQFDLARSAAGQSTNLQTRRALLSRAEASGKVKRLRRGLYATVPAGTEPDQLDVDPYLIASCLAPDSVLSYHTALQLHGKAYSLFNAFQYLTTTRARRVQILGRTFQPVKPPTALIRSKKELFGVQTLHHAGLDVRVTDHERTLVDCLDRLDLSGGWEEAWRSLQAVGYLKIDRVVQYVRLLDNRTTAAKVGYFLEQNAEALFVAPKVLSSLEKLRPQQPHYLRGHGQERFRLLPRWNLLVPGSLLDRSWEQMH